MPYRFRTDPQTLDEVRQSLQEIERALQGLGLGDLVGLGEDGVVAAGVGEKLLVQEVDGTYRMMDVGDASEGDRILVQDDGTIDWGKRNKETVVTMLALGTEETF